ncbi:hypothetical protein FRC14_002573 [Serendipita sp. 396]|nr:hypothetical protein FRC14_002573 [Serendipita sp. 396]
MELVKNFKVEKILNQDQVAHSIALLGTCPQNSRARDSKEDASTNQIQSILILKKTAFSQDTVSQIGWDRLETIQSNDIYHVLLGWLHSSRVDADVKIDLISPATETHIRKYSQQKLKIVKETPELYQSIVKPYITSFSPERTSWVDNILSYKSEAEKILYEDDDWVIIPDFKWNLQDVNTLYLQAITRRRDVKSLRDIRPSHLAMLRQVRRQAYLIVKRWRIEQGGLRLYVHYQPSYYHFHVHIVQVNYTGFSGTSVGQAHLLDDIISLLEVDSDRSPSIFERMTLTYTLGQLHGLYDSMTSADIQEEV